MYFRHMQRLNDVPKVVINKKQGQGEHKTLLMLWVTIDVTALKTTI